MPAVLIEYGFLFASGLAGNTKVESNFCWSESSLEHFKGAGSAFCKLGFIGRDGVQGMGDSTFSCQAENTEINTRL